MDTTQEDGKNSELPLTSKQFHSNNAFTADEDKGDFSSFFRGVRWCGEISKLIYKILLKAFIKFRIKENCCQL